MFYGDSYPPNIRVFCVSNRLHTQVSNKEYSPPIVLASNGRLSMLRPLFILRSPACSSCTLTLKSEGESYSAILVLKSCAYLLGRAACETHSLSRERHVGPPIACVSGSSAGLGLLLRIPSLISYLPRLSRRSLLLDVAIKNRYPHTRIFIKLP